MAKRMALVALLVVVLVSPSQAFFGEKSLLFETFESVSPPALPAGWAALNVAGDDGTWLTRPIGGGPWGVQCLRYRSSLAQPADDWFFTSAVNLPAGVPCGVRYMIRAGASGAPLAIEIFAGATPAPVGMVQAVKPLTPVTWTTYTADSASFIPPAPGMYYVGFHVVGPPAGTRLDLEDFRVVIPETDLRLNLGMSRELERVPLVFGSNDTMEVCVYVENMGSGAPVLNNRFAVGRWPSDAELDFVITGPAGRLPVINLFEKMGEVKAADFAALSPQQVLGKILNLWSWYQFDAPGSYVVEVRYHNDSDPGGLGAWRGTLVSDPLTITIQ